MTSSSSLSKTKSRMAETASLGVELWNDSCAPNELADAVAHGFVGATSNPVIVAAAVTQDKAKWLPILDKLIAENANASEDDIAWKLIATVVREGAALLEPEYVRSQGKRGLLCAQVSPKHWRNPAAMVAHARELASIAPNIAIKAPTTQQGIVAMEEIAALGIPVNATVSFTTSQAVAVADALARGDARAQKKARHVVTIMIGRVDDHVKRVVDRDKILIDPGHIAWAGIAVFKEAVRVFRRRKFEATLLAAAYRHHLHWTELVGPSVVQTIPYAWWKQFEASSIALRAGSLTEDVDDRILKSLLAIPEFVKAHDPAALTPVEFEKYGASVHTLKQFLDGYDGLVKLVRDRMLP